MKDIEFVKPADIEKRSFEIIQKELGEMQKTQAVMNQSLEEVRRVFSQLEMAGSDGKRIILYPGLASRPQAGRLLYEDHRSDFRDADEPVLCCVGGFAAEGGFPTGLYTDDPVFPG